MKSIISSIYHSEKQGADAEHTKCFGHRWHSYGVAVDTVLVVNVNTVATISTTRLEMENVYGRAKLMVSGPFNRTRRR